MWGRVRQTFQATFAWLRPAQDDLAQSTLTPAEFALFRRMKRSERQHHLRVLAVLLRQGRQQPALLTAALLHDVGKTRVRFTIPERILVVLAKKFLPRRFDQWAAGEADGWRSPFVASAQHPQWGAEMAAGVGSSPLAVELIRYHQTPLADLPPGAPDELPELLAYLQAADDAS
jgi:hypothetical protein